MANKSGVYWTDRESKYVIDNYINCTVQEMADYLGKSTGGVYAFLRRNKINIIQRRSKLLQRRIERQERALRNKEKLELKASVRLITDGSFTLLSEMKALIHLCEMTDNKNIRSRAKFKLMQLSQIPKNNPYGIESIQTVGM